MNTVTRPPASRDPEPPAAPGEAEAVSLWPPWPKPASLPGMAGLRPILSLLLALTLAASMAAHGARAAGMAMPMAMAWSADQAEPCDLCGGAGGEAAAQCALVCAGLTGVLRDAALLRDGLAERPTSGAQRARASRFAGPEPDPPR